MHTQRTNPPHTGPTSSVNQGPYVNVADGLHCFPTPRLEDKPVFIDKKQVIYQHRANLEGPNCNIYTFYFPPI